MSNHTTSKNKVLKVNEGGTGTNVVPLTGQIPVGNGLTYTPTTPVMTK